MFIKSRIYLDDEYVVMTRNYFLQYTQLEIPEFHDTLIEHMESAKKLTDKRALQKREYDSWVDERQMQTTKEKVDTSKALDARLVNIESSRTESKKQDTSSRSRNDAHADDADIRPIYDEEPMDEERGFAIAELKNELRKLTGNSVNTKFAKSSILGKLVLQPHRNQSVVRQPIAFKSERHRISKPWYSLNDMVHNHYLEEAKKKTQESSRNSEPSVMPSARSQSTANGSKPKPKINNQQSRNWPASKTSYVTTKTVPIANDFRNFINFSDSKHFVCLTCQKCVFNANHDFCVTIFLNEVNSHAKVPSHKTTNIYKPVEQISVPKKPERQIPTGHRFSIKKTFTVHEKITSPRSCLRWKPTGKIFNNVSLRWVPTGKIFTSSTTKVDSEPINSLNADITNQYECEQTLNVSVGTLNLSAGTSFNPKKEGLRVWLLKRLISQKPGL
nr:hypothetical protein [Tanacetum cinerariifolium]